MINETVRGEIGEVTFGFGGASVHTGVGEIARQLKRSAPGIRFELQSSQFSHQGFQRIMDGSLDLAIGRWDFLPPEIASIVVGKEEMLIAVPATHPAAKKSAISLQELSEEDWIVLPSGYGSVLHNRLSSFARAAGFIPKVVYTAPDSWTLVVLVGAEMGCALTLDSVRDNVSGDNVVFLPIVATNTELEVRLIWNLKNSNPALSTVVELAQRVFQE